MALFSQLMLTQGGSISLDNSYADIWDAIKKRMYIQAEKYGTSRYHFTHLFGRLYRSRLSNMP